MSVLTAARPGAAFDTEEYFSVPMGELFQLPVGNESGT